VEKESSQELLDRQRHQALLVFVSRISPAKRDLTFRQGHQPVVRDGNAVGVSPEIAEDMLRPAERPLTIDHPVVAEKLPEPRGEYLGLSKQF